MNNLWLCFSNTNRSPTMELYFKTLYPEHNHRSAGVIHTPGYGVIVTESDLDWADNIFVAEIEVITDLGKLFPNWKSKAHKHLFNMNIFDNYDRYDWGLASRINEWNSYTNPFGEVRTFDVEEWLELTENLQ